ncbi:hypothetical protein ACET3Z_013443 [Daucus carota]
MSNKKGESCVQNVPHVESSDSEQSYRDSESDTCESDEDGEEEINNDVQRVYPLLQKLKNTRSSFAPRHASLSLLGPLLSRHPPVSKNPNASNYQNKSIDNWDDICTLFASDRLTGESAEQYEESAAAMEMENELGSGGAGSEAASGESNKKVKRDRLADAVTKFAESFCEYVSKARGPPRPSSKEIYDVISVVPYIFRMQIRKGVKSFMNGTIDMFEMLKKPAGY